MEKNLEQEDRWGTSVKVEKEDQEEPVKDQTQDSELRKPEAILKTEESNETKDLLPTEISDLADGDNYDDLDDMLDEFCPVEPKPITPITPTAPEASTKPIPEDEFEKQLEAEMVELFGDLKTMPEMATGLENMLEQMGVTMAKGQESKSQKFPLEAEKINTKSGSKLASTGVEENFQDAINKTMERMAASGDQATAAAASEDVDSMVTEFLKAMQASDLTGEGNVEEDFSKALLGMMEQLTSKEILYEPMKELDNKFPAWIEEHGAEVDKADLEQYKLQQTCVREIVEWFQSDKYNDDSATDKEYIVERMQKMQAAGSPPAALVGDLAAAQEALGASEEGCLTQ